MVSAALSRKGGGVAVVVEALSRAVADAGVDVAVFGPEDEAWIESDRDSWRGATAYPLTRLGPAAIGYMPDMVRRLIEWNPDIVHSHGIWMHPSRSVLQWARATGRPYMISPHGMLSPPALQFSPLKKKTASMLFQARCFGAATALHATCHAEYEEIRAYGLKQPVALFANGVNIGEPPAHRLANDTSRVLSLGRIHPKKGLYRLIEAWAELENDFPNWSLDIVGPDENSHSEELTDLRVRLGLQRVTIRGPVYDDEKQHCLADAELFALPTLSDNFALTVAESLVCETPVISTKGAPWQGLEKHACGWWIEHGVEPLSQALRQAMSLSREERAEMGRRGRAWMEQEFSWPAIAGDAIDVYCWLAKQDVNPTCLRVDEPGDLWESSADG